jgi:hypothetical protein
MEDIILPGGKHVQFTTSFKYLGCMIRADLSDDDPQHLVALWSFCNGCGRLVVVVGSSHDGTVMVISKSKNPCVNLR